MQVGVAFAKTTCYNLSLLMLLGVTILKFHQDLIQTLDSGANCIRIYKYIYIYIYIGFVEMPFKNCVYLNNHFKIYLSIF